jgi:hypothetical protein
MHIGYGHWHRGFGWAVGIYAPTTYIASDCYVVKKLVDTLVGLQVRRITVSESWTGNSPGLAKRSWGFSLWPFG